MSGEGPSSMGSHYKITGNKRGKTLLHAGYSYILHRINKKSTVWVCVNKRKSKCSGAIKVVQETDSVHFNNKHSSYCLPSFVKNEVSSMISETKKEVCRNFESVQKIYEMNAMKMKNKMKKNGNSFTEIPDFKSVKGQLYRSRNKYLKVPKTHFKEPKDVTIPELFKSYVLIDYAEDNNRILVFASNEVKRSIAHVQHYFGDGTFDCCPKPFEQIYTIHGDIGSDATASNIVPLFYALLVNKETSTYETMLTKIKEVHPGLNPKKFTLDFEIAAMNAIKNVFPKVIIHGCFVHYQRCIFRRAKSLGLLNHEESKQHVKSCISLAFLPKEDIEDGWLSIIENSISEEHIIKFNDYFVEQWLEPSDMISKWCCYKELHRSTNLVEAWNQRLQKFVGRKPSLLQLLQMIALDISTHEMALERWHTKDIPIHKRKRKSILNDTEIRRLTEKYDNKQISMLSFLQKISSMISIQPKV